MTGSVPFAAVAFIQDRSRRGVGSARQDAGVACTRFSWSHG